MARGTKLTHDGSSSFFSDRTHAQEPLQIGTNQTAVIAPSIATGSSLGSDRTTSALNSPTSSLTSLSISGNASSVKSQCNVAKRNSGRVSLPKALVNRSSVPDDAKTIPEDSLMTPNRSSRTRKPTDKALELAASGGKFYASLNKNSRGTSSPECEEESGDSHRNSPESPLKAINGTHHGVDQSKSTAFSEQVETESGKTFIENVEETDGTVKRAKPFNSPTLKGGQVSSVCTPFSEYRVLDTNVPEPGHEPKPIEVLLESLKPEKTLTSTSVTKNSKERLPHEVSRKNTMLKRKRKNTLLKKTSSYKKTRNSRTPLESPEKAQECTQVSPDAFQEDTAGRQAETSEDLSNAKSAQDTSGNGTNLASSPVLLDIKVPPTAPRHSRGNRKKGRKDLTIKDESGIDNFSLVETAAISENLKQRSPLWVQAETTHNKVDESAQLLNGSRSLGAKSLRISGERQTDDKAANSDSVKTPNARDVDANRLCELDCLDESDTLFAFADIAAKLSSKTTEKDVFKGTKKSGSNPEINFEQLLQEYCQCKPKQRLETDTTGPTSSPFLDKGGKNFAQARRDAAQKESRDGPLVAAELQEDMSVKETFPENTSEVSSPRRLKLNPPKDMKVIKLRLRTGLNKSTNQST